MNVPTAATSLQIDCHACDGRPNAVNPCEACGGEGRIDIVGCPLEQLTGDTHDALLAAELADKGSWPLHGGWLDQTRTCFDAVQFIRNEEAEQKARMSTAR